MVVFDFRDTYHEKGRYEFKIVLDKNRFKVGHEAIVTMLDPLSNPLDFEVKKWGRKLNCSFIINESTPDGVCVVYINLLTSSGKKINETLQCWIVK